MLYFDSIIIIFTLRKLNSSIVGDGLPSLANAVPYKISAPELWIAWASFGR